MFEVNIEFNFTVLRTVLEITRITTLTFMAWQDVVIHGKAIE
ncbi:hypothetical protein JCM19302_2627 [Jejuia pallidilutea]|uniref:Uncharacterized protein n=1 Tax=Jejuia pallidilutea TaxID=504487 RepID=A0A090WRM5_9FLAO|nr:hypothetical protein JCM19302_2627 [Jejuia pallidilutea]